MPTSKGSGRGFASMSAEKKREIASKGGKAAHAQGTAHKWTSEEAQAAGRKGGSISRRRPKSSAIKETPWKSRAERFWRDWEPPQLSVLLGCQPLVAPRRQPPARPLASASSGSPRPRLATRV